MFLYFQEFTWEFFVCFLFLFAIFSRYSPLNRFPSPGQPTESHSLIGLGCVPQYCLRDGNTFRIILNYRRKVLLGSHRVEAGAYSCN